MTRYNKATFEPKTEEYNLLPGERNVAIQTVALYINNVSYETCIGFYKSDSLSEADFVRVCKISAASPFLKDIIDEVKRVLILERV